MKFWALHGPIELPRCWHLHRHGPDCWHGMCSSSAGSLHLWWACWCFDLRLISKWASRAAMLGLKTFGNDTDTNVSGARLRTCTHVYTCRIWLFHPSLQLPCWVIWLVCCLLVVFNTFTGPNNSDSRCWASRSNKSREPNSWGPTRTNFLKLMLWKRWLWRRKLACMHVRFR